MKEGVEWTLNLKDLATGKLEKFNLKLMKADQLLGKTQKQASLTGGQLLKMGGVAYLASQGFATLSQYAGKTIDLVSEYEKFNAVLTNTFGSARLAGSALAMLYDFAAKTPFQANEITEAYVKLANRGLRPTMEDLTALGDFASATGKNFSELGEAVMDVDNAERWKEFGVKVKRVGDNIELTFGNRAPVVVKRTADAVMNAVVQMGRFDGVAGGMAAQSKTLGGQISNLKDQFDQALTGAGMMNEGFLNTAVQGLSSLIKTSSELLGIQPMNIRLLEDEEKRLYELKRAIRDANTPESERLKLIKKLKQEYPGLLKNINAESASIGDVTDAIDGEIEAVKRRAVLENYKNQMGDLTAKIAAREGKAAGLEVKFIRTLDELVKENPELAPLKNQDTGELMNILAKQAGKKGGGLTDELMNSGKLGVKYAKIKDLLGMGGGDAVYSQKLFGKMRLMALDRESALNPGNPLSGSLDELNQQLSSLQEEMKYAQGLWGVSTAPITATNSKVKENEKIDSTLSASSPKVVNITMDAVMKGDIVFQNATDLPQVKQIVKREISNTLAEAVADAKILGPRN